MRESGRNSKFKINNLTKLIILEIVDFILLVVGYIKVFGNTSSTSIGRELFAGIVLVMCFVLVFTVGYLLIYNKLDIGKVYPIIAVTLGVIFIFLIPAYETPDEQRHFGSAYNQSNMFLDYGNPHEDGVAPEYFLPFRYMRANDASIGEINTIQQFDVSEFDSVFDNLRVISDEENEKVITINHFNDSSYTLYFLPALGITLARLLHLGFGFAYVFGALLNMLFYILMTTYAINKIPVGKRILFVISLLPLTLQQVSSFSCDGVIIASIMVVVAQAFFLKYGDSSTRRDWKWNIEIPIIRTTITELVIYILCGLLLSGAKSGVYLVVLLLPVMLCCNKNWFRGKAKIVSITVIVVMVAGASAYMYFRGFDTIYKFINTTPEDVREIHGQTGVALIEYIYNPGRLFELIFNTLRYDLRHYVAQIGGSILGYIRINIFKGVTIVNLLLLFASMIRYKEEDDIFKVGNRLMVFIIGLIPILVTVLAMLLYWTLPTDQAIMGIQGRYVLPTLAVLMFSVGRWNKIRIPNIDGLFAIGMTLTGYMTCISVLSYL